MAKNEKENPPFALPVPFYDNNPVMTRKNDSLLRGRECVGEHVLLCKWRSLIMGAPGCVHRLIGAPLPVVLSFFRRPPTHVPGRIEHRIIMTDSPAYGKS